jgi:hypothetical protein
MGPTLPGTFQVRLKKTFGASCIQTADHSPKARDADDADAAKVSLGLGYWLIDVGNVGSRRRRERLGGCFVGL